MARLWLSQSDILYVSGTPYDEDGSKRIRIWTDSADTLNTPI